jgi:hypothetical protein
MRELETGGDMAMSAMNFRAPQPLVRAAIIALSSVTLLAGAASAQRVAGVAFGSYVNAAGVAAQSPVATLPDTGGIAISATDAFAVPSDVGAQWLEAVTTGAVDAVVSSSQSTSELENVSILNGLITADVVTAIASSYRNGTGAASGSDGSGFVNLVVGGVAMTTDVAPNTRVNLPGVGYAILNEQVPAGDGVTSAGLKVNMIHVYLQSLTGGILGGVLTTTGEIIVASATSSVGP